MLIATYYSNLIVFTLINEKKKTFPASLSFYEHVSHLMDFDVDLIAIRCRYLVH